MKEYQKNALAIALALSSIGSTALAASSMSNDPGRLNKATTTEKKVDITVNQQNVDEQTGAAHFKLTKVNVKTKLHASQSALEKITSKYVGRDITMTDLNAMTQSITKYLRTHGYPAAAAYAPEQRAVGGVLEIDVLPGKYGNIYINNKSKLLDSVVKTITSPLKTGGYITTNGLESVLYRLNDLGALKATGTLSPGSEIGTSDLTIQLGDTKNERVILYAENYGTKAAGRYRYGFLDDVYDVDHHGEHVSVFAMTSNDHLHNFGGTFELPYGRYATTLGVTASRSNYELGQKFKNEYDAQGRSENVGIYANTPLLRTTNHSQYFKFGADYHRLKDELRKFNYDTKRRSYSGHVGFEEQFRNGKNYTDYEITTVYGNMDTVSDDAKAYGEYAAGQFTKGLLNVESVQAFDKHWDLLLKGQAQLASKDLDSSEQFYLGGANGVRAYGQGEATGDKGYQYTGELRYHTNAPGLTLSTYYDGGHVVFQKSAGLDTTLRGWGLGLTYTRPDDYFCRFDYARRIGLGDNLSNDARSSQRMWFIAGKIW